MHLHSFRGEIFPSIQPVLLLLNLFGLPCAICLSVSGLCAAGMTEVCLQFPLLSQADQGHALKTKLNFFDTCQ